MIKLISRVFSRNNNDNITADERLIYGNLSGIIGIVLNLLLFAGKLIAGIISSSVSVVADAFNNLSDAGSSVVTFIGFRLARKPADREHPFGHGRYEYLAGLGISVAILLVGFELIKSSFLKILHNEQQSQITRLSVIILIGSVIVKMFMYFFNKRLSKLINSKTLRATALDSLTDSIATSVVIAGLIISRISGFNIDGYLGIAVAIFILYTGLNTFKESLSPLLGNPPSTDFVEEIKKIVLEEKIIIGVHDIIVHDYGVGKTIVSLHAEISEKCSLIEAHDSVDRAERKLEEKFGCMTTIHLDPVDCDNIETLELKCKIADAMCEIDREFSIHDFRVIRGENTTKVIFDLAIPYNYKYDIEEIRKQATQKIKNIDKSYEPVIQIEQLFSDCV